MSGGKTLNRPGLKCRSQTTFPLLMIFHGTETTRRLTLDWPVRKDTASIERHADGKIVSHSGNAEASLYLSPAVVSQCTKTAITNVGAKCLLISPCASHQTSLANSLIPRLVPPKSFWWLWELGGKQISIIQTDLDS